MDYIRELDVRLEREMFYAGEYVEGAIYLETIENFKLKNIRISLRGRAHVEWKAVINGDQRKVETEQQYVNEQISIFDKSETAVPILTRGTHTYPFRLKLPESSLPCSFESKLGNIRYYIRVTLDIPYASPPTGTKYFTVVGPHIDCMDEQYLKPVTMFQKKSSCCFCCKRGPIVLKTQLLRSAYVCGESIKLKATIDNNSPEEVKLKVRLSQFIEYVVSRGMLTISKDTEHPILEMTGDVIMPYTQIKWDSNDSLIVPILPPTLIHSCKIIHINYVLKVSLEFESKNNDLIMNFPITIATVPFRIPNSNQQPKIYYGVASEYAEGGSYIAPEFLLGQVYDGANSETVVLYRPVYIAVKRPPEQELETDEASRSFIPGINFN